MSKHSQPSPLWAPFNEADFLAKKRDEFMLAYIVMVIIKLLVNLVANPGVLGKWNIYIDRPNSKNLFEKDTALASDTTTFESADELMKRAITSWKVPTRDIIGDAVQEASMALTTSVIMPAGDVFTFAGLDTDDKGNLYSQINFANDGDYKVIKAKPEQKPAA